MYLYHYEKINGEYIGSSIADIDPLASEESGEDVYLIPSNSTKTSPPEVKDNSALVFNGVAWLVVDDFRGQTIYRTEDKTEKLVTDLGAIPEGYTVDEPGPFDDWEGGQWVTNLEKKLSSEKIVARERLDLEAGNARSRFLSVGDGIAEEYRRAYELALAFKAEGYAKDTPSCVADNMRYKNLTLEASTLDIINEGDALNHAIDTIRSIRLDGKLAVSCVDEGGEPLAIIQPFIDKLLAIGPQKIEHV